MNAPSTTLPAIQDPQNLTRREATSFPDMIKMGDALVKTGFLPDHIKTGAQAAAIILTGAELGMPPMRALRSLNMVKGKVVENADSQLARFKADGGRASFKHGRCTFVGCKAKKDKDGNAEHLDDEHACLWLRHPNGDEHVELWATEHSKRARLGEMHDKFPRAMYRSRVITAGLKSLGWEGAVGNYDPDEVRGFDGAQATASPPAPLVERGPTDEQASEIKALLAKLGVKKERGTYIDAIIGGRPESIDDYALVIEELRQRVGSFAPTAAEEVGQTKSSTITPAPTEPAKEPPKETAPTGLPKIDDGQKRKIRELCDKRGATRTGDMLVTVAATLDLVDVEALGDLTHRQAEIVIERLSKPPAIAPSVDDTPDLGDR